MRFSDNKSWFSLTCFRGYWGARDGITPGCGERDHINTVSFTPSLYFKVFFFVLLFFLFWCFVFCCFFCIFPFSWSDDLSFICFVVFGSCVFPNGFYYLTTFLPPPPSQLCCNPLPQNASEAASFGESMDEEDMNEEEEIEEEVEEEVEQEAAETKSGWGSFCFVLRGNWNEFMKGKLFSFAPPIHLEPAAAVAEEKSPFVSPESHPEVSSSTGRVCILCWLVTKTLYLCEPILLLC